MVNNSEKKFSRRQVLATGTGLVAAAATQSVLGQSRRDGGNPTSPAPDGGELQNPFTQYPRPPFPAQSQPAPGLTSRMKPVPDHGETSYRGSGKLAGRKALITGGDSGIGRATAIAFAREGADVAFGYLEAEQTDADDTKKLIEAAGRKAVLLPGDVTDEGFCKRLVTNAAKGLGGLDIVVNNAGYHRCRDMVTDILTEEFERTFRTNVFAPFWIVKAAVPLLPAGAAIINTSSSLAYTPAADQIDYSMTKACLISFTKGLAKQLLSRGIRVNAVAPGPFWTPFMVSGGRPDEYVVDLGKINTAVGRPGQPVELAPVYVFLASAAASFVTGEVYAGAGGQMPY